MSERGYYRVVLYGEPTIALFEPDADGETEYDRWYVCAVEQSYETREFDSIGDKIELK